MFTGIHGRFRKMVNLYLVLFLAFLVAYIGCSVWASFDPNYLVGLALVAFAGAALASAFGDESFSTITTEFAFVMILGSLSLALIDYLRGRLATVQPRSVAGT